MNTTVKNLFKLMDNPLPDKEMIDHPKHYGGEDNVYEAIKIIEAYNLNFSTGNVIKYVLRAGKKDRVTEIQDLKKALWYLQREINNRESIDE